MIGYILWLLGMGIIVGISVTYAFIFNIVLGFGVLALWLVVIGGAMVQANDA